MVPQGQRTPLGVWVCVCELSHVHMHGHAHTYTGICACAWMPTSTCTPHVPPNVRPGACAHTHTPKCGPRCPQNQALCAGTFPCCVSLPRQGSAARLAAPCQLPWQCCACQQMKFALPCQAKDEEQPGEHKCPCSPRVCPSACTLWCCPRDVYSLAAPAQPRFLTAHNQRSSYLTSHRPADCKTRACVKECPLVGHLHPIRESCLLPAILPRSKPCRTVLAIAAQPLALPVVPAASSISRAHWGLPTPHAGSTIVDFLVLTRAGTHSAGFYAQGTGCCCAVPCHGSQ